MIEAFIGESVILSRRLLKNNKVVTGADLKVRAIQLPVGNEVLASTSVPETLDPGCYAFEWSTFPSEETFLKAIYTVKNISESELIQVKRKRISTIIAGSEFLTGSISSDTLLGLVEDGKENISGKITDQEDLSGIIEEEVLSGAIVDGETTFGEITEDTITGELEDC